MSLATIGFLWNRPWTIAFPTRLLSGDWPSWTTHLYWYVLLAGTLLAFDRTGKSPYCPWVCPFGAAQDVIGLAGGARRRRTPSALLFTWVKRGLLWLAVLLGLLYRSPGATSYEVFAAFFRLSGTGFQYAILGFVLVTAVFVSRPFCSWVCPVDATERAARAPPGGRPAPGASRRGVTTPASADPPDRDDRLPPGDSGLSPPAQRPPHRDRPRLRASRPRPPPRAARGAGAGHTGGPPGSDVRHVRPGPSVAPAAPSPAGPETLTAVRSRA